MLGDRPKYISNEEAYQRIASKLGTTSLSVQKDIATFLVTLRRSLKKQVKTTISGFGIFTPTVKGNALLKRRATLTQKISDRRHKTYNDFNRKKL